jgi:hypothetical protein
VGRTLLSAAFDFVLSIYRDPSLAQEISLKSGRKSVRPTQEIKSRDLAAPACSWWLPG